MPLLHAQQISYQLDNGRLLFDSLSCQLSHKRVGLVGNNGVGKSLLAAILCKQVFPTSGRVVCTPHLGVYYQQTSHLLSDDSVTIARYLNVHEKLDALQQVASGDCASHWFDVIGDDWNLRETVELSLREIGVPCALDLPCSHLSGGQLAKLQLLKLLNEDHELLILDEPSNHLDSTSKHWLKTRLGAFKGTVLLITHDRELLEDVEQIWELSEKGLHCFGGNFDYYQKQKHAELAAVERQLNAIDKQKRQMVVQAQKNHEKAQQRASQGNKLRKDKSQPKVLLDKKRDSAQANASTRNKNHDARQVRLQEKETALKTRQCELTPQQFYMKDTQASGKTVISLNRVILPFGTQNSLSLTLKANEKCHVSGANGCGKSTLLKTLIGRNHIAGGTMRVNTPTYYLDQHFSIVAANMSVLDNLLTHCNELTVSDARTLLAGIGLRGDSVLQKAHTLSGGQKMKVAMLIVSHQITNPFLLLDEPDNHLDIEAKTRLSEALSNYKGGLLLVSHDKYFVRDCGITQTLML